MTNNEEKILSIDNIALENEVMSLDDVIDNNLLRYILTILSSYTGSATFIMSNTHKETCTINSVSFCDDVFRKTERGAKACDECDAKHCKEAAKKGKSILYKCHNGIYTSATPVYDGKNHIGSIMCGQVLFEEPDLELCKQKAKEYGIDEKTYIEAYKQIPIVSEDKFKEALKQVEMFAKELSNVAVGKRRELKHIAEEDIAITLLNALNENMDVSEIVSLLIGRVAEILNVDRILIENFFDGTSQVEIDYFVPNKVSDDVIRAIQEAEREEWVRRAWQNEAETNGLVFFDDINNSTLQPELKKMYSEFGLRSAFGAIIKTDKEPKIIVIEKFNKPHTWTNNEKAFLNVIAKELSLCIEQAKKTNELEQQLSQSRTLMNNMPFELWMRNIDGKYLDVSDVWLKNNKLKKEQVIGKCQDDIFPEGSFADEYKPLYAQVLETKEAVVKEIQEVHKNKRYCYHYALYPVVEYQGNIVSIIGFKRDITEQKENDRQKSEFVSMVSHELRTPLTSIISGLRLALSGVLGKIPHNAQTALELSERNSKRLLTVVNDILDIEKLSANRMNFSFENVNVRDVIEETIKEMESFASKYNVVVNYKANSDDNELQLFLDKARLIQILSNLISNAIKFTENDRDVEIIVNDLPDDKIRISVINYGIDISEEHRKEIYDNFFKITSINYSERQGAGLGLSVAHRLVKDMKGTIDYVSRHGKTVFFVEFDKAI